MITIQIKTQDEFDVLFLAYRASFPKFVSESLDNLEICVRLGKSLKLISQEYSKVGDDTYRLWNNNENELLSLENAERTMLLKMLKSKIAWPFTLGEALLQILKVVEEARDG